MWFEIFIGMQTNGTVTMSPLATATWSDEDFIGRVSRVGRSAHGAVVSISAMRKSLGMYKRQFEKTLTCKRGAWKGDVEAEVAVDVFGQEVAGKWVKTPWKP